MQFLNLDQIPNSPPDVEFRESCWDKLIAALVCLGICGAAILPLTGRYRWGSVPTPVYYLVAGSFGLMALLILGTFRGTLHPANWLIRVWGDRLYIKFRSYLNDHFPADEVQVVQLDRREIAWVRPLKLRTETTGARHETELCYFKYLEIGLAPRDTAELQEHLRRERQHQPVGNRFMQSKSGDYPVSVQQENIVRVCWGSASSRVSPRLSKAIEFFSRWTTVQSAEREQENYLSRDLAKLPPDEQDARLRKLAETEPLDAVRLACLLKKCSIAEAQRVLDVE